jgi:putative FmdB family regulatory protein
MPLYEYECRQCGERVEIIQRSSDPTYEHCPKCGGDMKKLASAPAIQFKGSGFYKTDYPSKSATTSGSNSDAKSESKGESKSESKSDSKPDSKGGAKTE